ncbi:MAG: hypothetical protein ACN6O3_06370 [Comamonas sp.]
MDTLRNLQPSDSDLVADELEALAKALRSGRYTAVIDIQREVTAAQDSCLGISTTGPRRKLVIHAELFHKLDGE